MSPGTGATSLFPIWYGGIPTDSYPPLLHCGCAGDSLFGADPGLATTRRRHGHALGPVTLFLDG